MNLQQLKQYRSAIIKLAEQYRATNIRVFGSVAKGETTENSDIDFLIDPTPEQDLFDVIRLRTVKMAVIRELEIIGEAANKLPDEFKDRYPLLPWRDITDFRNVLAHHYWALI